MHRTTRSFATLVSVLLGATLLSAPAHATRAERAAPTPGWQRALDGTTSAGVIDTASQGKLPGLNCKPRRTPLRCNIYAKYRGWLAYLKYVGRANPDAHWSARERRYLRNHPGADRKLGSTSIFRHPGKRGFTHVARTRRDHRRNGIPAAAFATRGGPNYCTTLTISRLVESTFFHADLFTAYHKTRWCWDDNVIYKRDHGNWTEIAVHDGLAVVNEGAIASHSGALATRGDWYTSQQWSICNCAFHLGVMGHWQPLWQVWASPGGTYRWKAHW